MQKNLRKILISIHAPRTGSDRPADGGCRRGGDFNPRSPHGERPWLCAPCFRYRRYFNPRSPHGERRNGCCVSGAGLSFQSTLPARGATNTVEWWEACCKISIHAPRTGSDQSGARSGNGTENFNPRSPHGERPARLSPADARRRISIHAPRTGSDLLFRALRRAHIVISIHAPRTGSDMAMSWTWSAATPFQSTLPARGATRKIKPPGCVSAISIHAPRTGSDDTSTFSPRP